jgi:hypothetical protein
MKARCQLWIALVLGLAVWACGLVASPEGTQLPGLEQEVRDRALAVQPGDVIDLRDLAPDFEWSDMVIVGPYPDGDEFERVAGFGWNAGAAGSAVDETNVVAFVEDGHVAAWGTIRGDVYFLPEEDSSILVSRDDATFKVVVEDDGVSRRLDHVAGG